jgi:uncharacterized protein YdeI (YjbR/CyaY-like superfamily)
MAAEIFCKSQSDLETWLEGNHTQPDSVWLMYYKPSTLLGSLNHDQILETVLCYGWVDSLVNKVDDLKTKIRISPRNPKSNWSRYNKNIVEKLMDTGRMKPSGLKMVELAKQTGTWTALDEVENLILPPDLSLALNQGKLVEIWNRLPRSDKRGLLESLLNSKRQETRTKLIAKITTALAAGYSPASGRKIQVV